jgi:hypothetical protein
VLGQPVNHPSAWTADDMRQRQQEWVYQLTGTDVAELEAALAVAEATGKAVQVRQRGRGRHPGAAATLRRLQEVPGQRRGVVGP